MSLPGSRNTTYAAGSQVKSADLNALQDEIVALQTGGPANVGTLAATSLTVSGTAEAVDVSASNNVEAAVNVVAGNDVIAGGGDLVGNDIKHGVQTLTLSAAAGQAVAADNILALNGDAYANTGFLDWQVHVPLRVGDQIRKIHARVKDATSGTVTVWLRRLQDGGTPDDVTSVSSDQSGNWQTISTGTIAVDVSATELLFVRIRSNTSTEQTRFAGLWIEVARP